MTTFLDKSENNVEIHHLHPKCFYVVKRLRKSVQYIWIYSTKYASFLTVSYQLGQLWSYWTEVHEIFTRYRGIIYAVNAHIEVAISHCFSECQSDESGELPFFHKIGCHGNVPWDIVKRGPDRSFAPKRFHFVKKLRKSVQRILGETKSNEGGLIPRAFFARSPGGRSVMFRYYLLGSDTAAPSGLYARICHAFQVAILWWSV